MRRICHSGDCVNILKNVCSGTKTVYVKSV